MFEQAATVLEILRAQKFSSSQLAGSKGGLQLPAALRRDWFRPSAVGFRVPLRRIFTQLIKTQLTHLFARQFDFLRRQFQPARFHSTLKTHNDIKQNKSVLDARHTVRITFASFVTMAAYEFHTSIPEQTACRCKCNPGEDEAPGL